jgi:hypothetical protein
MNWKNEDDQKLLELHDKYCSEHNKWTLISEEMGISEPAARGHWRTHEEKFTTRLRESPYPRYDERTGRCTGMGY